ncbi:MAG TPA: hypothetical protein VMZ71_09120 [Gemmataceae bacterium]|nr:hypothetical protein [Gemmataceae bacterium]
MDRIDPKPTVEELAAEVLAVFAGQQKYFRQRNSENLVASKQAERKLKETCEAIVNPQPDLFQ